MNEKELQLAQEDEHVVSEVATRIFNIIYNDAIDLFKNNQNDEYQAFGKNVEYTSFKKYFNEEKYKEKVNDIIHEEFDKFKRNHSAYRQFCKLTFEQKLAIFYVSLNTRQVVGEIIR